MILNSDSSRRSTSAPANLFSSNKGSHHTSNLLSPRHTRTAETAGSPCLLSALTNFHQHSSFTPRFLSSSCCCPCSSIVAGTAAEQNLIKNTKCSISLSPHRAAFTPSHTFSRRQIKQNNATHSLTHSVSLLTSNNLFDIGRCWFLAAPRGWLHTYVRTCIASAYIRASAGGHFVSPYAQEHNRELSEIYTDGEQRSQLFLVYSCPSFFLFVLAPLAPRHLSSVSPGFTFLPRSHLVSPSVGRFSCWR